MLRTVIALALVGAAARPTAAQSTAPQARPCPLARMTLLGAALGFGTGAYIGFGQSVFEDTENGETKAWVTVIGLAAAGAVIGHVIARRNCDARSPSPTRFPKLVLSETELRRLSQTVRLVPALPTTATVTGAVPRRGSIIGLEPSQIERPGSPSMTCWRSKGRSPGFQSDAVWTTR